MKTFKIYNKDYYEEGQKLYKSTKLNLEENTAYCLVGCNGIGKSTIFRQLVHNKENFPNKVWDMCKNYQLGDFRGIFNKEEKQENYEEFYFLADRKTKIGKCESDYMMHELFGFGQSTGEINVYNYIPLFHKIKDTLKQLEGKTYYILFDDFDVGTSIDVLMEYAAIVKQLELELMKHNITYYILIAANSYELTKHFKCIDCITLKEKSFTSYEDYSAYVRETRAYKDKRDKKMEELQKKS